MLSILFMIIRLPGMLLNALIVLIILAMLILKHSSEETYMYIMFGGGYDEMSNLIEHLYPIEMDILISICTWATVIHLFIV